MGLYDHTYGENMWDGQSPIKDGEEVWAYVTIKSVVKRRYKVSNTGKVLDMDRMKLLQVGVDQKDGFFRMSLRTVSGNYKQVLLHRLVFQTFKPEEFAEAEEKKWQILHKDGYVRKCHLENLEAAPRSVVRQQRTQEISKIRR